MVKLEATLVENGDFVYMNLRYNVDVTLIIVTASALAFPSTQVYVSVRERGREGDLQLSNKTRLHGVE